MDSQLILIVCIVGAFVLLAYFVITLLNGEKGNRQLRNRLGDGGAS